MGGSQAYAVYWSIYTDWRGRRDFRKLYWDRLKDAIGRPAKLVGIEREDQWPSGLPSHELRCHVWRFFRAASDADATAETLRSIMRVAPEWRILSPSSRLDEDDLIEMIWDRNPQGSDRASELPFPKLTSILVSLKRDTGFRVRAGFTVRCGGEKERPTTSSLCAPLRAKGSIRAIWQMQVQTSTKRELMETHWPLLQRRFGGEAAELIDLEKRRGDVGPFRFSVCQSLASVTETEAIMAVLEQCAGLIVSVETPRKRAFVIRGRSDRPDPTNAHWLRGFEATWTPTRV